MKVQNSNNIGKVVKDRSHWNSKGVPDELDNSDIVAMNYQIVIKRH